MKITEKSTHRINVDQQFLYPVAPYTPSGTPDPPPDPPIPPMPPLPGSYKKQKIMYLITRKAKWILVMIRRQVRK